jgi:hypothetical protein
LLQAFGAVYCALATACGAGGSGAASGFGATEPVFAKSKQPAAVVCPNAGSYDENRGCVGPANFGQRLRVSYKHEMGNGFALMGAAFAVDGELLFDSNDPKLVGAKEFAAFETELGRGHHALGVYLKLRGNGQGVFSYLKGYRFEVRSNEQFEMDGPLDIRVVGHEQGGVDTPLERRPAVRYAKRRP